MAQTNSYEIANDSGLVVRGRINEVFSAVQSNNAGATSPTDTTAGMLWLDTSVSPAILRRRNTSNNDWDDVLTSLDNDPSKLFRRDNIVGTVAQSGGVPTGAIIERGSNANGEFTKFADGTMICGITIGGSATVPTTWTYPALFVSEPRVVGTPRINDLPRFVVVLPLNSSASFRVFRETGEGSAVTVCLVAYGSWY